MAGGLINLKMNNSDVDSYIYMCIYTYIYIYICAYIYIFLYILVCDPITCMLQQKQLISLKRSIQYVYIYSSMEYIENLEIMMN